MQMMKLHREPNLSVKHQAFIFQAQAVEAIRDLNYAAVFHEQGLGKSKIAIDVALYWLKSKIIDTVIIVAKKGLVENWVREIQTHSHLKAARLSQNKRENYSVFNGPSRMVVTHYEVFKAENERIRLFCKARQIAVILDESTKIKNPDSDLTDVFFQLADLFKKRVILTGTPVANRPYDIWAQIYFLDKGVSLGESFQDFKRYTDLTNSLHRDIEAQFDFESTVCNVFGKISSFSVRETKAGHSIDLPNKKIVNIYTDWETRQQALYQQVRQETRAIVMKNGELVIDESESILKRLSRLLQVASNPLIIDESYKGTPGKFDVLEDLVKDILSKEEKVIIWSSFIDNVNWLARRLTKYGVSKVHGKLAINDRQRSIDKFLTQHGIRILIATPQSSKEGLTLTVANHVIFFDRSFSLDDYLQAQDRIHRISQTKECYVYNLIVSGSIDEWIDLLLRSKHTAAKVVQGDIGANEFINTMDYSFGEIVKEILGT